ncbi:MAG: type II secretion system protein [Armatimonadetes bacterium]|nr:type II secretion system protein [Armatimonadota bacterium]
MKRRGFTLIELLVVISIIGVLVALLFPIMATAKKKAKETVCSNNLLQIGVALNLYRDDYDMKMPERLSHLVPAYITNPDILHAPLDPKQGQHDGSDRMEGTLYLASGVSYTWIPNWKKALEMGWWGYWPARGAGKWGEVTPVSACHWHWATKFNEFWEQDRNRNATGNALVLLANGQIRTWPGRRKMEDFNPDR